MAVAGRCNIAETTNPLSWRAQKSWARIYGQVPRNQFHEEKPLAITWAHAVQVFPQRFGVGVVGGMIRQTTTFRFASSQHIPPMTQINIIWQYGWVSFPVFLSNCEGQIQFQMLSLNISLWSMCHWHWTVLHVSGLCSQELFTTSKELYGRHPRSYLIQEKSQDYATYGELGGLPDYKCGHQCSIHKYSTTTYKQIYVEPRQELYNDLPDAVWCLRCAMYGLHTSPDLWQQHLCRVLQQQGLQQCHFSISHKLCILVYVDDLQLVGRPLQLLISNNNSSRPSQAHCDTVYNAKYSLSWQTTTTSWTWIDQNHFGVTLLRNYATTLQPQQQRQTYYHYLPRTTTTWM